MKPETHTKYICLLFDFMGCCFPAQPVSVQWKVWLMKNISDNHDYDSGGLHISLSLRRYANMLQCTSINLKRCFYKLFTTVSPPLLSDIRLE